MKKNILIADKDEAFLKELSEMLTMNNFNSKTFIKLDEAFAYAKKNKSDIIIFDIGINGKDYYRNFEIVKSLIDNGIKIIATISYCDETNFVILKINSGIKTFFIKPVIPLDIIEKINKIINTGDNHEK